MLGEVRRSGISDDTQSEWDSQGCDKNRALCGLLQHLNGGLGGGWLYWTSSALQRYCRCFKICGNFLHLCLHERLCTLMQFVWPFSHVLDMLSHATCTSKHVACIVGKSMVALEVTRPNIARRVILRLNNIATV